MCRRACTIIRGMLDQGSSVSSTRRRMKGGSARGLDLPSGINGRALCRWCSLEVPKGRQTFCSAWCVHEWRLRSDPSYVREKTFERDRGICAICSVDTVAAYKAIRRSRGMARARLLADWGLSFLNRRTLWDADHVIPVIEGGGECDLDNIRTLCLICHRKVTRDLRGRRQPAGGG